MKRVLLAFTALSMTALAGVAQADGTDNASPFVGTYLGVDLGYGWGDANSERYGNIGGPLSFTQANAEIDGVTFGGHLGHNWSLGGNWLIGVEGGVKYSGLEGDDGFSGSDNNEFSADWEGSLAAHVGVAITPRTMLYALGGYSWLSGDSNVTNAPIESVSGTYGGWKLGAGVEYACTQSMTVRLQFTHTDYGSERLTFTTNNYDMETGPSVEEISVGLSWRL